MADNIPDPQQQALFREVDEDLRHEQMQKLWKQFGPVVIAASVLIVLVVAGYQGWKAWQSHQRTQNAVAYEQALSLAEAGKDSDAIAALNAIAAQGGSGTADFAQMQQAALLQKQGKTSEALSLYQAMATSQKGDPILRNMAALHYALLGLASGTSTDLIATMIAPLAAPGLPFEHSARQIQAVLALKEGRIDDARKQLQDLADDASTPSSMRSRAKTMLQSLENAPAAQ